MRAVFLDRDGVINAPVIRDGLPYPPAEVGEFVIYEDVAEGCARLKEAGFLLVVATNQPDVGRGTQSQAAVEAMHAVMSAALPIDRIEVCYDPGGGAGPSPRRKPAPGMLLDAAEALSIRLSDSYMIGDRWRDVDCGHAAGCKTIFIDRGYRETLRQRPDFTVGSFAEATDIILAYGAGKLTVQGDGGILA
jgi:D-glycero-D-manno-heptose 1,7-bisphosphate phosphatase